MSAMGYTAIWIGEGRKRAGVRPYASGCAIQGESLTMSACVTGLLWAFCWLDGCTDTLFLRKKNNIV